MPRNCFLFSFIEILEGGGTAGNTYSIFLNYYKAHLKFQLLVCEIEEYDIKPGFKKIFFQNVFLAKAFVSQIQWNLRRLEYVCCMPHLLAGSQCNI